MRIFLMLCLLAVSSCAIETGVEEDIFLFLVVNEIGDHEVELSWTVAGNEGPVTYRVAVNDSTVVDDYTDTRYTVTELDSSTEYTIAVFAKDAAGNETSDGFQVVTLEDTIWEGPYELDSQEKYENFNLTRIVGELRIRNLETTDLARLESLEAFGSLLIENCQMSSLNGLQNVAEFIDGRGGISMLNNPNLTDVTALENLSGAMVRIRLENNPSLQDFSGLGLSDNGFLELVNTPVSNLESMDIADPIRGIYLKDLTGFTTLGPIASRNILQFVQLENLPQFSSLVGLENTSELSIRLILRNLPALNSLQGLEGLQAIGTDPNSPPAARKLVIDRVNLTNLEGLANLNLVSRIELTDCDNLQNLDGTTLTQSIPEGLSLYVQRNAALTDFCGLSELANNVSFMDYVVSDNAYNPTVAQLRSPTDCSQ